MDSFDDNLYAVWYRRFVWMFAALGFAVLIACWLDSSLELRQQLTIVSIVLALFAWFWFYGQWHLVKTDLHAVIYLLGNVAGITALIRMWDTSALMLFAFYWFGFAYLHTKYAIVYAFVLTFATQWAFGTTLSDVGFNTDTLVPIALLIAMLGFSYMMARYIEAFHSEAARNAALVEELKRTQQSLIEKEREEGIEQERHRVAGEIHDTIAQHFTSIITNLRAAEQLQGTDPTLTSQHVMNAFSSAQQGLADSRAMLSTMQPDVLLGRSLTEVLDSLVSEWSSQQGAAAGFETSGNPVSITRQQELMFVRALQESLRNIGKHANAESVDVTLTWLEDEVLLDITDNGIGFDPESVQAGADGYQMGLSTMQSRVESAGGTYALESAPGEGTSITVSFPTGGSS